MIIYGKQPVYYVIDHHPEKISTLFLAKEIDKKEYSRLMRMNFAVERIPEKGAQAKSRSGNHQGFLAEVEEIRLRELKEVVNNDFVVVLSGLTDVGNIGAIIRSAYALGVGAVIVCGLKQLGLEPILRSSSGALFDMPLVVQTNLFDVLNELKLAGFETYGAVMNGEDIRGVVPKGKRALILGNESEGIPARAEKRLDHRVSIAMANDFDSLNVSAAAAILMDRMR